MRYILVFLLILLPAPVMAGSNGINNLTAVSSAKADNTNDKALHGADTQRDNMRVQQHALERKVDSGMATGKRSHKMELQQISAELDDIKRRLDSMRDMADEDGPRLQMMMSRLSKMQSTLSNLLKKSSETSQGITQNLK